MPGPVGAVMQSPASDNLSPVPRLGQQQLRRKQMTDTREQISQLLRHGIGKVVFWVPVVL
jgi:hypothetical protein